MSHCRRNEEIHCELDRLLALTLDLELELELHYHAVMLQAWMKLFAISTYLK